MEGLLSLLPVAGAFFVMMLKEIGARLGDGWTERLRRAWVHYTEDCEALNMEVTPRGHRH
ncbi:MAG: hypothetical protein V2I57_09435 [Xanthomonadales bacterium]|jgi:hypothetical protein|nr:hypothetical protein [Xanthomonadales bacterium]